MAEVLCQGATLGKFLRLRLEICHVNRPSLEHRASADSTRYAGDWDIEVYRNWALVGGRPQVFPVEFEDHSVVCSAEARRAFGHSLQHRLEVRRGGANDA